jgi:glycosyltransferase involved in cell wall biosynthesis
MKVCMLAEKLPPEFTGSGKQAAFLAKALVEKGISTIGICSNPYSKTTVDRSWGFPIFRVHTSPNSRVRSVQFAFRSMVKLLQNRHEYDILHVHGYCLAAITSLITAKCLGKKALYKVAIPGDDDIRAIRKSRLGCIKAFFIRRFDKFIAISDFVRKGLKTAGCPEAKIVSIPNGVEKRFAWNEEGRREAKQDLIKQLMLDKNCKIISYVGSIQHLKGIDVLARAWPLVVSKIPSATLLLVGPLCNGKESDQMPVPWLHDYIGKSVFLVGIVENPEVFYRASDVFVFPSRNESFGNVLVEAMGCGTACVATRIEGVTEQIITDSYDGIVVEQEDIKGISQAILTILRDPTLAGYLGRNAAETVDRKFRMERVAEEYRKHYCVLLNGGNIETHPEIRVGR